MSENPAQPVALTIAGSDSGGAAGIQADLLTFAAFGVHGTSAITSLTAQNPDGVSGIAPQEAAFVSEQMEQVASFFELGAVKTGMLHEAAVVETVAAFLRRRPGLPAVVDPVMVASSGAVLLEKAAIAALREHLLPRATLITPNLDEAAVLINESPESAEALAGAAARLAETFGAAVLLKGGHLEGDSVTDVFCWPGEEPESFTDKRIEDVDTHGSGCTLSSAIAAALARGHPLEEAVARGRAYLRRGLEEPLRVGPRAFISHGHEPPR